MGKKTSVYLTDSLAEQVEQSGLPLADLIRLGLAAKPRLVDEPAGDRTWTTWWFCDVPARDAKFKVLHDEWHTAADGRPVREIFKVEVTDPGQAG